MSPIFMLAWTAGCARLNTLLLLLLPGVGEIPLLAQPGDKSNDRERSVRTEQMRELAGAVAVYAITKEGRVPVQLVQTPLMRFSDMSRGRLDGTL
jgi:hypothetical protein